MLWTRAWLNQTDDGRISTLPRIVQSWHKSFFYISVAKLKFTSGLKLLMQYYGFNSALSITSADPTRWIYAGAINKYFTMLMPINVRIESERPNPNLAFSVRYCMWLTGWCTVRVRVMYCTDLFYFTKLIERGLEFLHASVSEVQVSSILLNWEKVDSKKGIWIHFQIYTKKQEEKKYNSPGNRN